MSAPQRIAVVGMACRYPDATGPAELWQTVLGGRRAFRRIPPGRLSAGYRSLPGDPDGDPDTTYLERAAVLEGWSFDRARFSVPRAAHAAADHTHWLALATADEALRDAGLPGGAGLDRDGVGVVLGNSLTGEFSRAHLLRYRWPFLADAARGALGRAGLDGETGEEFLRDYAASVTSRFPTPGEDSLAGGLSNTIAGRICNHFDFHGGGFTVDGACSSSLLAVVTAARALATGEIDVALTGGVDLSLDPFELVGFARLGALARQEMRVYDAEPTGFLPGEGCGVLVLMRAERADRLGLRTYAYLTGWGVSSDGAGGLTRPDAAGQRHALRRAYRMAAVDPGDVGYVEGHGTGTAVGDRVEIESLAEVRGPGAAVAALGSVKANIGHTKAAAGVAGLIKALTAVHERVVPPTTGCPNPHPLLARSGVPLHVPDEARPWAAAVPRAGVSAFGFGGINVHVVVEGVARRPQAAPACRPLRPHPEQVLLAVRAPDPAALHDRLREVQAEAGDLSDAELHDLAAGLWSPGGGGPRCALVARGADGMAAAAGAAADRIASWDGAGLVVDTTAGFALGAGTARVGLLFPGQAAPVRPVLPDWARTYGLRPITAEHVPGPGPAPTDVAQEAVVRQCLAGLEWLQRLGCKPVGAVGHSLGELCALAWAGCWKPATCQDHVAVRGHLMRELGTSPSGMLGVELDDREARGMAAGTGVVVAARNGARRTVLAGPADGIATVRDRAAARGIAAVALPVSHAFHSPAMSAVAAPWRSHLEADPPGPPDGVVISTVTGMPLTAGDDLVELLVRQLTAPVEFRTALARLAERCDLLVEVGPGRTLAGLAREGGTPVPAVSLDCAGPATGHATATAALYAAGAADLSAWFSGLAGRPRLPGRPLTFLGSPCETRPDGAPAAPARPPNDPPGDSGDETVDRLRAHLSRTLDLPLSAVHPGSSLLSDLHVGSLELIRTTAEVAAGMGRRTPALPTDGVAELSVAELAELIRSVPAEDAGAAPADGAGVPGVATWVRPFGHRWTSRDDTEGRDDRGGRDGTAATADGAWTVLAPAGHWLHRALPGAGPAGPALAVVLESPEPAAPDDLAPVADALRHAGRTRPDRLLVVHHGHPGAAALGRAVAAELPGCATTVVELPRDARGLAPGLLADHDAVELRVRADGSVERLRTTAERPVGRLAPAIGPGEVCLVTGGVGGITLRAGQALAERTGCRLVALGRRPAPSTATPSTATGPVHYLSCDVTEPAAVAAAVAAAAEHGPVRGLLHGAAVNEARPLGDVTAASLARAVAPKVTGLRHLLDAVGDRLTLAVAFSSIIGRGGLDGQSEYCVANDAMRVLFEAWAAGHPGCRSRVLEWSVWSRIGMGADWGVVDALTARGIRPITPDEGAEAFLDAIDADGLPTTVLLGGRFPAGPALTVDGPRPDMLRFQEDVPEHTPGVEIVTEARISTASDHYLDDHRIDGVAVLPGVVGLEAVAQTASAVAGPRSSWSLRDVAFDAPVLVDDRSARTVRVAGLARASGAEVDVELRTDRDGFGSVCLRATAGPAPAAPPRRAAADPAGRIGPVDARPFYGPLFFHGELFRRVQRYHRLSALRVQARIAAAPDAPWFSPFHRPDLVLGDLGALDAAVHVLLACVPHRRALPVGADALTVWRAPHGPLDVSATERAHTADDYVFDVDLSDPAGAPVARWEGLRLRASGPRHWDRPLPWALLGPYLTRRMIECGMPDPPDLSTDPATGGIVAVSGRAGVHQAPAAPGRDGPDDRIGAARAAVAVLGGICPAGPLRVRPGSADGETVLESPGAVVLCPRVRTDRGTRLVAVACRAG